MSRPLKIVSIVHGYPPNWNAGSEWMLHQMNLWFKGRGHDVAVICDGVTQSEFEGVKLHKQTYDVEMKIAAKADVFFTHHNLTTMALNAGFIFRKPVFYIQHSQVERELIRKEKQNFVVYNSYNVSDALKYTQDSCIVYPYCPIPYYKTNFNKIYVTLVNHNKMKGGLLLVELAKRMPHVQFAGLKGGYFEQIYENLPNLHYFPSTPRIKEVLKDTAIVLMPSISESFGRVAIEAACSGIPSIVHPTDGLQEALGEAGIFCNRNNINEWVKEIDLLLSNEQYYNLCSEQHYNRAKELQEITEKQLENLEQMMYEKVGISESAKNVTNYQYKQMVYGC